MATPYSLLLPSIPSMLVPLFFRYLFLFSVVVRSHLSVQQIDFNYFIAQSPLTPILEGRIRMTTAERFVTPHTDDYYLDWDNPAAIIMMISSIVIGFLTLVMAVFIFANAIAANPVVRNTSISFHIVQLSSMFVSCFITFIFIGDPPDSTCAFRPWTSLCFTFVYGNVLARQIAVFTTLLVNKVQSIRKHDAETVHVLTVKYGPFSLMRNLFSLPVIHIIILVVWTAVDRPSNMLISSPGPYNTEVSSSIRGAQTERISNQSTDNMPRKR